MSEEKKEPMSDKEYIDELEKTVIFLADVYSKGYESLGCQTDAKGKADDKWVDIFMFFPTIQGSMNRIWVERIGNLRTKALHNREATRMGFKELYERISENRDEVSK